MPRKGLPFCALEVEVAEAGEEKEERSFPIAVGGRRTRDGQREQGKNIEL